MWVNHLDWRIALTRSNGTLRFREWLLSRWNALRIMSPPSWLGRLELAKPRSYRSLLMFSHCNHSLLFAINTLRSVTSLDNFGLTEVVEFSNGRMARSSNASRKEASFLSTKWTCALKASWKDSILFSRCRPHWQWTITFTRPMRTFIS